MGSLLRQRVLVGIVGPTATGKTSVGIELAAMLDGETISADSMAIYRGMDIGTAKPTAEEQSRAVFHLIDVVRPDEEFTVADFQRLAEETIADIRRRGKVPILVGGTGLYVKALTEGLNIPSAGPDWELREELRAEAEEHGGEILLSRLREFDPETAERLHPNDIKRIIRAIEVYTLTGRPLSEFHRAEGKTDVAHDVRLFGLTMSRESLYRWIERRIDDQLGAGLVAEVRELLAKGYTADMPSMQGLGYKQIAAYLNGECDYETAIELFKRDTRRFAKRQFTWFRADKRIHWLDAEDGRARNMATEIAELLAAAA